MGKSFFIGVCILGTYVGVIILTNAFSQILKDPYFHKGDTLWDVWCTEDSCPPLRPIFDGVILEFNSNHNPKLKVGVIQCIPFRGGTKFKLNSVISGTFKGKLCLKELFFDENGIKLSENRTSCVENTENTEKNNNSNLNTLTYLNVSPNPTTTACVGIEYETLNIESKNKLTKLLIHSISLHRIEFLFDPFLITLGWVSFILIILIYDLRLYLFSSSSGILYQEISVLHSENNNSYQNSCDNDNKNNKVRFEGLNIARFLATFHITFVHLYKSNDYKLAPWGESWVPFFFLLSGFVLSSSLIFNKKSSELTLNFHFYKSFLFKRWISVYPLFILSIFLKVGFVESFKCKSEIWNLISMIFMIHGWTSTYKCVIENNDNNSNNLICVDTFACIGNEINVPSWFLTSIAFFWLFILPLHLKLIQFLSTKNLIFLIFLNFSLPQIIILTELFSIKSLKYNPILFFHIFISGMIIAFLHYKIKIQRFVKLNDCIIFKYGSILSLVSIYHIMITCNHNDPIFTFLTSYEQTIGWSSRMGLFLPFHSLLIISLSLGHDIILKPFKNNNFFTKFLIWLGEISYPWYILQEYAINLTTKFQIFIQTESKLIVFIVLLFISVISHYFIQLPILKYYSSPKNNH